MTDTSTNQSASDSLDGRTTELRTFLVADIRGYTRFSQEQGDLQAARLASRFADLSRDGVAARGGQVVGIRGDDVGIGLAAGEVTATDGRYHGRAVNLAERLCSMARAGEVLASDGLLHLAGRTPGLQYIELREIQLPGFSDLVKISQVIPEGQGETAVLQMPGQAAHGALRIQLLGGFRVTAGSRVIDDSEWRLKKAATLVKFLALSQVHRLHREQVIDLLWPDLDPSAAGNNLHHALHVARRILEPVTSSAGTARGSSHTIRLQSELITLEWTEGIWVDVEAFEEAASRARQTGDVAAYRAALDLYGGDLLPEDLYEDWVSDRREGLRALHEGLLIEVAGLYEARSEFGAAIDVLQRAVASNATLEEAHVGLMRLYASSGQRHQALRQYEQLQGALQEELAVEPDRTTQDLYAEILAGQVPGATTTPVIVDPPRLDSRPDIPRHNLPVSLTSFVGREREQRYIEQLLDTTRLLTLTGPGGAGKTRLALVVARDILDRYRDGVRLVELASLSDSSLVAQAIADVVDVRDRSSEAMVDAIVSTIQNKEMLLILDNCEHLIDACAALVETFLSTCPRLHILTTSREGLSVPGEVTWIVPPLTVPDPREMSVEDLQHIESVRLFVDRARQRQPNFELLPANMHAVAEIVRRLDGIPLAIELAAARVGVLTPEQIAGRLEDALGLLTGGRRTSLPHHQTLRATLDWSYDLLDAQERTLFNHLSVFSGGWTLEAAEMVGVGERVRVDDVLDLLSRLMDKSLILTGVGPEGIRYRMLGSVRQYGAERLQESGEEDSLRHRHAILYLSLSEQAEQELKGPRQIEWLNRLDSELDNIRAALSWALHSASDAHIERIEIGLRLASALWQFWHSRGHIAEGRTWLRRGLEGADRAPAAVRAKALNVAGWHAHMQNDVSSALAMLEEALRIYRTLGDQRGEADALERLGDIIISAGDHEIAREHHERSLAIRRKLNDRWGISKSLNSLSLFLLLGGDPKGALAMLDDALKISRALGDQRGVAVTNHNMGMVALESRQFERAVAPLAESLRIFFRQADKRDCSFCLEAMARVAGARGMARRAARLFGSASSLRADIGDRLPPDRVEWLEQAMAASRSEEDERGWQQAWEEGRRMPLAHVVEYALSGDDAPEPQFARALEPRSAANGKPSLLSPREMEVAALIAEGLTNRQIAARLIIAERTVDTHVGKILGKLELASRAQVAAWITEQRAET